MEIVNRVESVAFDKTQCTDNTAKGVLVGIVHISDRTKLRNTCCNISVYIQNQIATSLGHIFECTLSSTGDVSSSILIQIMDAGTPVSISSLQIDTVAAAKSTSRIVVMCTSSKPARLYHFVGQLITPAKQMCLFVYAHVYVLLLPGVSPQAVLLYRKSLQLIAVTACLPLSYLPLSTATKAVNL
jgi:hypothetical protein